MGNEYAYTAVVIGGEGNFASIEEGGGGEY